MSVTLRNQQGISCAIEGRFDGLSAGLPAYAFQVAPGDTKTIALLPGDYDYYAEAECIGASTPLRLNYAPGTTDVIDFRLSTGG